MAWRELLTHRSLEKKKFFLMQLYRCIKEKLWPGRKDDPEVRIEPVEPDAFALVLGQVTKSFLQPWKEIYHVKGNRSLDSVRSLKWDERIMNCRGDFACVVEDTVWFWMSKRAAILRGVQIHRKASQMQEGMEIGGNTTPELLFFNLYGFITGILRTHNLVSSQLAW